MKRAAASAVLLTFLLAGCGGGTTAAEPQSTPGTAPSVDAAAQLKSAAHLALAANHRLSVQVLWTNRIPSSAATSTGGPALRGLRSSVTARRHQGVRIKMLAERYEILRLALDPSFATAQADIRWRQRVQPSDVRGRPTGHPVRLDERAHITLRRVDEKNRFVVWKVELAQ
jgi:hypothetical protein